MKNIKSVAIFGAGAMGAYFSTRFFEAPGFSTVLIAKNDRFDRLNREGIEVNGKSYKIPVVNPDEAASAVDLIIVALKHHHLLETVNDLKNLVGEKTVIISVMNGLDSEAVIGSVYGTDKILYAISVGIDAVREGNRVRYSKPGLHYFGEADNHEISTRVQLVQQAFDKAGINYDTPVDMLRMMWWKFMVNVGVNPTSAVLRAPYGVFQTSPEARELMEASMREVISLAKVAGVNLTEQDVQEWTVVLNTLSPDGKTSMLQDIEAGFKTEVEIFCEKVVELGKTHDIPTPVNQTLLRIIRVLEQNPPQSPSSSS